MFKLSVISDEVSQNFEQVAKFARKHGLQGVEVRNIWNHPPQNLLDKAHEIKSILSKYGLKTAAIASPLFKTDIDNEDKYREHINILRKTILLAKYLDTSIVRGFTFWRKGIYEDYAEKIVERFQEPLDIVREEGVILAIENEYTTFTTNAKLVVDFLQRIKSNSLKAIWDPGNDIADPLHEVPYPNGYEIIRNYIVHIHVKDAKKRNSEHEWVPIGEGDVDYIGQIKALIVDRYEGYLSLETHWRPKIDRKIKHEVRNQSLSEKASEICIKKLKTLALSVKL